MIKTIIFDLDGVLIESKEIHFKSLNKALPFDYRIGYEEHLSHMMAYLQKKNLNY